MPKLSGARQARLDLIRRTGKNLDIRQLAERLGHDEDGKLRWSISHLTSVENGYRPASLELAALLAHHYGVGLHALIEGTVPDRPPPQPDKKPTHPAKRQEKEEKKGPRRLEGVAK
jgi:transcriptional regulator with XRE-family HTH domain